jgi:HD-GYP domain-containing protein (c-di-GMP phosphodiesterase class II)
VGKVAIAASVLQHPGPLTSEQMREVQKHPDIGARIVANAGLDDVARWVQAHHERPDGCGYPRGLDADRIPVEAKILAAADAYEAMTGVRLYRPPLCPEAAEQELARCAGSQFDEQVVEALVQVTRRQAIEARPNAAA